MSSNTSSTSSGGIGVFGLLGVVFVVLKIIGVKPIAAWSWWWVTAPFWGPFVVVIGVLILFLIFYGIYQLIWG